ncbi:hypothetical protein AB3S75_033320 [Citrus x aurantiifolia]
MLQVLVLILTTCDWINEIDTIRKWHPRCDLLIRIKALDDSKAVCPQAQDSKCGANLAEIGALLEAALASQLGVVGVSFHIGSGATDLGAFDGAISAAKAVFDAASARHGLTDQMRAKHWRRGRADCHFGAGPFPRDSAFTLATRNYRESSSSNRTCTGMIYNSTVFGPTLDAYDKLFTGHPELQLGNWLVFSQIGACTAVYGSGFKGFNTADIPTCLLI